MDVTLEDNMGDGLFFCVTLSGRRGGHTLFVEAGVETPDAGAEAVKPDHVVLGRVISEGGCRCWG